MMHLRLFTSDHSNCPYCSNFEYAPQVCLLKTAYGFNWAIEIYLDKTARALKSSKLCGCDTRKNVRVIANPCPFCFSKIVEYDPNIHSVKCFSCNSTGPIDQNRTQAVNMWNTRKRLT